MSDIYNAIKEIETTEISKLQKIVDGYKALKDLLIELQHKSQEKDKLKPYTEKLEKLLVIYERIFEIVGDNAEKYVHEEIGVSFEKQDDEAFLIKKLLQFIANDAFFVLREKLISATTEYNELNLLLTEAELMKRLDNPKIVHDILGALINCTQLAVQFSLLVQALAKHLVTQEKSNLIAVIQPLQIFASTVANYANEKTRDTENKKAEIVLLDTLTPTDSEKSTAHIIINPEFKHALEKIKKTFEDKIQTLKQTLQLLQQDALDILILKWPNKLKNQAEIDILTKQAGKNAEALINGKHLRTVGQEIDLIFLQNFSKMKSEIINLLDQYTQNQIKLDEITVEMEKLERDPVFKAKRQCQASKTIFLSLLPEIFQQDTMPDPKRVTRKAVYQPKPYDAGKDSPVSKKRSKSFIGKAIGTINKLRSSSDNKSGEDVLLARSSSPTTPRRNSETESTSTEQLDTPSDSPPSSHKHMISKLGNSIEPLLPSSSHTASISLTPATKVEVSFVSGNRTYANNTNSFVTAPQSSNPSAHRENAEQIIVQGGGNLKQRTASLNLNHLGNISPTSPRK